LSNAGVFTSRVFGVAAGLCLTNVRQNDELASSKNATVSLIVGLAGRK
jgi:hypothetical protein